MRKENIEIKDYLNEKILKQKNRGDWYEKPGENYGTKLQKLIGQYYEDNKNKYLIKHVEVTLDPNSPKPDIQLTFINNTQENIEVKSCKNKKLDGVTICNSPYLLTDTRTFLVNYIFKDGLLYVNNLYDTELHRLTTIQEKGKYIGTIKCTRDTGKKVKGRSFSNFLTTKPQDDYSLEELKSPALIRKTILMYSVSKLVDQEHKFTNDEIIEAVNCLKAHSKN
ncbi:hypothetical protein CIB95_09275 [Lottiidibacillus patelloidae]|uniref:Uncharacterized protein n=1 Tax=Lottiidibacillus patelloidae TaxID=2670334 RepID=A0A263BTA3_9BACI|nr:hypothetical protein [Lottiidibacillus patelloidae]OZM56951.1 hypothetical protein CIB95_09275 [Lottiidibacillus patelloidae]